MTTQRRYVGTLVVLLFAGITCGAQDVKPIVLHSPSGAVTARLGTTVGGGLYYELDWNGKPLAGRSLMGVVVDGHDYGGTGTLVSPQFSEINEIYSVPGVKNTSTNHAAVVSTVLSESGRAVATIEARAYDDGFAWRMKINGEGLRHVSRERSTWSLPAGTVWYGERNNAWKLKSYAGEFISTAVDSLPQVSTQGPVQAPPLVIEVPGRGYELITEAALINYSGMRLEATGGRNLRVNFIEGINGFDVLGTVQTPWRVTLLANDLNQLVNSDLITNLNPPPNRELYSDVSYIRPGRSVWRWWSRQTGTPEQEMQFIDYAASLGFEYSLIDDGWDNWPDRWREMTAVCAYAKSRGVGVFAWKDYRYLSSPEGDWRQLREFFDSAKEAGLAGVKIDFLNAESKDRIDFEHAALTIAAKHKMMIDFHGLQKPTGERRTYPNEISSEAVRGIELNKMAEGPITSAHNTALPFTRLVVGPADYTPLSLTWPGETTWTHQLATAILFTSPLLVIAEDPEFLLKNADVAVALDFIKSIPSTWDETRVLPQSEIGKLAVIARRKGTTWYIGVLNGLEARDVPIDVSQFIAGAKTVETISSPQKRSFHLSSVPPSALASGRSYHLESGDGLVIRISR